MAKGLITNEFAILAPVPVNHLKAAIEDKLDEVAFGSTGTLFHEVGKDCHDSPVIVYIYASWMQDDEDEVQIVPPAATWRGEYIGYLDPRSPRDRQKISQCRPRTTEGENGWGLFWIVKNLRRLSEPVAIHELRGCEQKAYYKKSFIPERPLLIEHPGDLD